MHDRLLMMLFRLVPSCLRRASAGWPLLVVLASSGLDDQIRRAGAALHTLPESVSDQLRFFFLLLKRSCALQEID